MQQPVNDLEHRLLARAAGAWATMSADVAFALCSRLFGMNPFTAIKEVGTHDRDGAWSFTPFAGASRFGELGLDGCKYIHDKLCARMD